MKQKFLGTFFATIVLLFSLLLSGCETPPPVPIIPFSFQNAEMSYDLDEPYMITLQYKNDSSVDGCVGLISCCGLDEDKQTLTERELLLEIKPFYTAENDTEKTDVRIAEDASDADNIKSVTVEIPKSHFVSEKGYIRLLLLVYYGDEESNSGFSLFNDIIHYEKIDGQIHFEKVK